MARAVYSTQFLLAHGTPLPEQTYTVPSGFVAVIREVRIHIDPGTSGEVDMYAPDTTSFLGGWASVSGESTQVLEVCRTVLQAGQSVIFVGGGALYQSLLVSGYLLTA